MGATSSREVAGARLVATAIARATTAWTLILSEVGVPLLSEVRHVAIALTDFVWSATTLVALTTGLTRAVVVVVRGA